VYLPFVFDSTTALGQWELTARVHDAAGHRVQGSARLEHVATSFLPGTQSPPTVWNVTPTHAAPGELIQVRVRDVERVDLTNSVVRVGGVPARIQEVFEGGVSVVVPLDTSGARVELTTQKGGTAYRGLFQIDVRPRLEPTLLSLVPGQPVQFRWDRRLPADAATRWNVGAGEITADGWYRAPAFAPEPMEVRVRGAVTVNGVPWEDEVVVKIEASPVARGSGLVSAVSGGSVWSEDLAARIDFPGGALARDTVVTVRTVSAGERPEVPLGFTAVGGVEFGPDGLQFERPATMVLPLSVTQVAGATIPIRIWNPREGRWEDEILDGVVGLGGREVRVKALHFSTYVPVVALALVSGRRSWRACHRRRSLRGCMGRCC